jgi:DnaK suppressor protein
MQNHKHIRELLQRQASALRSELQALQSRLGDAPEPSSDDRPTQTLAEYNTQLLHRVLTALESIDDGSYGICTGCGVRLPEERLRAVPWATRCMRCSDHREHTAAA